VAGEPGDDRRVAVNHAGHDLVEHRLGAACQELRIGLHPLADSRQVGRPAVAHGEHEVRPGEDVDLAELHLFDVVEMMCDWIATASRNSATGPDLDYNAALFGIALQLGSILRNTCSRWPVDARAERQDGRPATPG